MAESDGWSWKSGALLGFGECAWQEKEGRIRKVTVYAGINQGRVVLAKPMSVTMMEGGADTNLFDASKLVVVSAPARKDIEEDLKRVWSGSNIILGNGGQMRPPPPPGPRLMIP